MMSVFSVRLYSGSAVSKSTDREAYVKQRSIACFCRRSGDNVMPPHCLHVHSLIVASSSTASACQQTSKTLNLRFGKQTLKFNDHTFDLSSTILNLAFYWYDFSFMSHGAAFSFWKNE